MAGAAAMTAVSKLALGERVIRLDRSENAYGPSPRAMAAMKASVKGAHADPNHAAEALRKTIAAYHHLTPEQVTLGCGDGEMLRMAVDAFAPPGRRIVVALPTVEAQRLWADRGADLVEVPLRKDHAHDLDAMLASCDARTGLIYICNPNCPTGTLTRRADIEAFLRRLPGGAHVLIDEAYHDYIGGSPEHVSFADCPVDDDRVIVSRSFSTIHGLADLRLGYAIAAAPTAQRLAAHRAPDDLPAGGATAALAALADVDYLQTSVTRNADDRQEFFNQVHARMLRAIDSRTNFVMLDTDRHAVRMIEHFRTNGIVLPGPVPEFENHVRVSLGTPPEMHEFWRVMDLLPRRMMKM